MVIPTVRAGDDGQEDKEEIFELEDEEEEIIHPRPYVLPLMVNRRNCDGLIDTGAAVSLIPLTLVREEKFNLRHRGQLTLTGITSHKLKTYGVVSIPLILQSTHTQVWGNFIVCDDRILEDLGKDAMLLGRDFLSAHKARLTCDSDPVVELMEERRRDVGFEKERSWNPKHEATNITRHEEEILRCRSRDDSRQKGEVNLGSSKGRAFSDVWTSWLQEVGKFYAKEKSQVRSTIVVEAQVHKPKGEYYDTGGERKAARDSNKDLEVEEEKDMGEDWDTIELVPKEQIKVSYQNEEPRIGDGPIPSNTKTSSR